MKMTQQERNAQEAAALGFTEIAPTMRYRVFDLHAHCERTGSTYKLFLGKAGAVRFGSNISNSRPCRWDWLKQLSKRISSKAGEQP